MCFVSVDLKFQIFLKDSTSIFKNAMQISKYTLFVVNKYFHAHMQRTMLKIFIKLLVNDTEAKWALNVKIKIVKY